LREWKGVYSVYNSDFELTSVLHSCYVPLVLAQ
jgi:hypothetical protein